MIYSHAGSRSWLSAERTCSPEHISAPFFFQGWVKNGRSAVIYINKIERYQMLGCGDVLGKLEISMDEG